MWGDAPTKAPPKKWSTALGTSSVEGGRNTQFPFTYSQEPIFPTGEGVRTEEEKTVDLVPEAVLAVVAIDKADGGLVPAESSIFDGLRFRNIL